MARQTPAPLGTVRHPPLPTGYPGRAEYAATVRREAQALRYRAHEKLLRAFLDEEVYDGRIRVEPEHGRADARQRSLLDD